MKFMIVVLDSHGNIVHDTADCDVAIVKEWMQYFLANCDEEGGLCKISIEIEA